MVAIVLGAITQVPFPLIITIMVSIILGVMVVLVTEATTALAMVLDFMEITSE